jgi:hypothetical protein
MPSSRLCALLVLSVILAWRCASSMWLGAPASVTLDQIVAKFNELESKSIHFEQYKARTNEEGELAWGTSYALNAYLYLYQATGDQRYLNKFVSLADALAQQTDANRGVTDYKGRSRVGWGSGPRYSKNGERIVWLAHSAVIVYPLARFALIVKQTSGLSQFAEKAGSYQQLAETALHEFDNQWRSGPNGEGFYVFEKDEPAKNIPAGSEYPLPFNMELSAGRVCIVLWKLTGNSAYREKAEGLAKTFKKNLAVDPNGAYQWHYFHDKSLTIYKGEEDFGHASADIGFAVEAYRESIVFTRSDIERFVGTFIRYSDASSGTMLKPNDSAGLWLLLSEVDCRVYRAVLPFLMSKVGPQHPQVLQGVAELAFYYKQCGNQ